MTAVATDPRPPSRTTRGGAGSLHSALRAFAPRAHTPTDKHRTPPQKEPGPTRRPRPQPTPGDTTTPPENVRVTDHPATDCGRCYLVERELEQEGPGAYAALQALVADYLEQARLLHEIPMAGSIVRRYLEQLVAP
jgi:hypothetical protein